MRFAKFHLDQIKKFKLLEKQKHSSWATIPQKLQLSFILFRLLSGGKDITPAKFQFDQAKTLKVTG